MRNDVYQWSIPGKYTINANFDLWHLTLFFLRKGRNNLTSYSVSHLQGYNLTFGRTF